MNVLIAALFVSSLCFVELPCVDAKCGTKADTNIVTINSNLAISVCSDSIIRVVKAPSSKEFENATMQTQNKDDSGRSEFPANLCQSSPLRLSEILSKLQLQVSW